MLNPMMPIPSAIKAMYRILLSTALSCIVVLACAAELNAQPPESRPGRGQGGGQRSPRPTVPAQPDGEQTAAEQSAPAQPDGAQTAAEGETITPTVIPPAPANSLIVLADFAVAGRLGLNDQQRAEIRRIIDVQRQEMIEASIAKATDEQFHEIYKRNEEKLSNVLTASQKAVLPTILQERKIRFVFRFQAWKDVLQWLADQAGMQLVMAAPPPGTFNYVDQEERTITEAIDLVNRVLMSQGGYTLVRDDRMLRLLDLKKNPPNRDFPLVKPEELQERGSYEFISVTFPLERRNREAVMQGIEPFKSEYTRAAVMPGNNLMIIDTAEALRALQKIINSVENPPEPRQPQREDPPPPRWGTYVIEKNEPAKIEEIFKEFVPSAKNKIIRYDNSKELHVYVPEPDHAQLKEILEMLEADAAAGRNGQVVLRSYPVAQYLESAQSLAQDWRMERVRRGGGQQQGFPGAIPPGMDPNLFNLAQFNPLMRMQLFGQEISAFLKKTFPNAVVSDNLVADNILVLATAADQEKVNDFFESLRPSKANQPTVRLYRYTERGKKMNETTRQHLQALVPNALLTLDAELGQILVVASEKDQELLTKAVSELEAATLPSDDKILRPYRLSSTALPSFMAMVQQLVNQEKLRGYFQLHDEQRNQVLIWATEKQHDLIQNVYAEVTGQSQQAAADAAPVPDAVVLFTPKNISLDILRTIIEDVYPAAKLTPDTQRGQLVIRIRPEHKDPLELLLAQLDADDPEKEKRRFKPYPIETGFYSIRANWSRYTPVQFIADLQRLAPRARISFDEQSQQLLVWGTDEEHAIIEAAIKDLIGDGKEKKISRFPLRRTPVWMITPVIDRMYPTVEVSYDDARQAIIVEGHPRLLPKVGELIELLDPEEPSAHDPIVKFYTLKSEPTEVLLQGLRTVVPWPAQIIPDREGRQIMVIAKPAEQKIIEANTELILSTFTPPEEPMLCIYPVTTEEREWLTAFIEKAAVELRHPQIIPEKTPEYANRVSIWARPTEQKLIATVLKQIQASQANVPDKKLKVFLMSVGDLTIAQNILKASHPGAMLVPDTAGNRLLVWATAAELEKVTETLRIQGSIDDRQMLSYPIAGVKPENAKKVILDVYPGLKITEEPQTRKLLVWASPEEHVKVAEIVEQINKEVDPDSELAEKFKAYSAANLNADMVVQLFKTIIPEAQVHTSPDADKIVVRAIARDHQRIEELFVQLREKDDALRPQFVVYTFDEIDPVMIEIMLRNLLKNAESMSPDDLVRRASITYYYERMPWFRYEFPQAFSGQTTKTGYYNVDPETRSAYVFVTAEQHKEVKEAVEQLVALGNQEGIKPVVRRYTLDEIEDIWDVRGLIQQVAPSARLQMIYTYSRQYDPEYGSYGHYTAHEFIAYARESEHEKLETLVKELNDRAGTGRKELLTITLPEGSPYSRERIIETLQRVFTDVTPIPGGTANQILVWATKHRLEQIRKMIADISQPLPAGERTVPKTYPLHYIGVEEAVTWLSALYPNVVFDPEQLTASTAAPPGGRQRTPGLSPPRTDEAKFVVAVATPLEHTEIEQTIKELDKNLPDSYQMEPRVYALDDMPPEAFDPFYDSIVKAFPNAVATPSRASMSVMVVAVEDDHKKVADFVKAYRDDSERKRPSLEIYGLKQQKYDRIADLLQRIAPAPAVIAPGAKPDQVLVWGTLKEQRDISEALTKLELAAAKFHDPIMKPYHFKYVDLYNGYTILSEAFAGQATINIRWDTRDMIVYTTPDIHTKIAASIDGFDVPRPAGSEVIAVPYDMSDIMETPQQVAQLQWYLPWLFKNRINVTQGITPGQILVFGQPSEQEQVKMMVDRIRAERPGATAYVHVYTLQRSSNMSDFRTLLPLIAPSARLVSGSLPGGSSGGFTSFQTGFGSAAEPNQNQVLVWAKESDHIKIKDTIEQLNAAEPDIVMQLHSLKNINYLTAGSVLNAVIAGRGLDIRFTLENYGNQYIVLARPENQKIVAEILDSLRVENRELLSTPLEFVDPLTAQAAIATMFADEIQNLKPYVQTDVNTNSIFVLAIPSQLERIAKMLRDMGENVWYPAPPAGVQPGARATQPGADIRTIHIRGGAETLRELERIWKQTQPNPLRIMKEEDIKRPEDGESPSLFSLEDEIQREDTQTGGETSTGGESAEIAESPQWTSPPVYVIINADGSLSVTSADTAALNQLESLLKKINSGIMFEGRDYTIYSVRNIDATVVEARLRLVLWERLLPPQQRSQQGLGTSSAAMVPLSLRSDRESNSIFVQGTKADRQEVGKLIAMFDVSNLPGERAVPKPISVPILSTANVNRVLTEVLNLYQARMNMVQLPGGVRPRIIPSTTKNSLEIFAPEPLATELKEYIEEVDRKALEEPGRKFHVIPLNKVKAQVLFNAINQFRQSNYGYGYGGYGMQMQSYPYANPYGYGGAMPMMPMQVQPMRSF